MEKIIGRLEEQAFLNNKLSSNEAELIVVYGRRRIGKTFLIRNVYEKQLAFEFSGVHHFTLKQQLENFGVSLSKAAGITMAQPGSWIQAFGMLEKYLTPKIKSQRKVVFFDEFPWINSPRSGFLPAFENFWNAWASRQPNLIVVICGSSAAWMIQKVINNRGGLHNRLTGRLRLLPFTVGETADFLQHRKVNLDHYQVLQLYMAMGGVPQYLKEINPGESATQAIDRICFTKEGFLHEEFKNLFHSLFDNAVHHMHVIRTLAKKSTGLTRNEIIEASKLTSGGGASQILEELTESGFIAPYVPFGKTAKESLYKLTDEYSLFYLKFIESGKLKGAGTWAQFTMGSSWKGWSGIAFESVCLKHVYELKKVLGIVGINTEASTFRSKPQKADAGVQIDLLIDRQDACINICEIKFSNTGFEMTKAYAKELENKLQVFRSQTGTKKTLFLTMITTFGVKNPAPYAGLIQHNISMEFLFKG